MPNSAMRSVAAATASAGAREMYSCRCQTTGAFGVSQSRAKDVRLQPVGVNDVRLKFGDRAGEARLIGRQRRMPFRTV